MAGRLSIGRRPRAQRMAAALTAVLLLCGVAAMTDAPQAAAATGPTSFPFADPDTIPTTGTDYVTIGTTQRDTSACGASAPGQDWIVPAAVHGSGNLLYMNGICAGYDLMPSGPGAWAGGISQDVWAPSIIRMNGTYRMYYAVKKSNGQACVGRAVSSTSSILGPYVGQTEVDCPSQGRWAIDPDVFTYGGNYYMTYRDDEVADRWLNNGNILSSALGLVQLNGSTGEPIWSSYRKLLDDTQMTWDDFPSSRGTESIIENPSILKVSTNNHYYLTFSGNAFASPLYGTGVADCGPTLLAGSPGLCTPIGSTQRPYWGYSDRANYGSGELPPVYLLPNDYWGPGGMSLFRNHGGAARATWHWLNFNGKRYAMAGELSFNGSAFAVS